MEEGDLSRIAVSQENQQLSPLNDRHRYELGRLRFLFPSLSMLASELLYFKGKLEARLIVANGRLEVPAESLLATLGLGQAWLTYHFGEMKLVAGALAVIENKGIPFKLR